jgi:glycosyltransferase involved in cell wall biosynthesis
VTPALRVVLDGRVIQDRYHGIGRHALELARAMARLDAQLLVLSGDAPADRLSLSALREDGVTLAPFTAPVASMREQLRWPLVLRNVPADVLLIPYHLATPWASPVPAVAVVHDCIFESDPRFAPSSRVRHLYQLATRIALRRTSAVVTVSHATRTCLAAYYGLRIPPENVVHHGVDTRFGTRVPEALRRAAREELALPERYVLHVGVRRPHKNQATLVRAFAPLAAEVDADLVLVGDVDKRFPDPLPGLVGELELGERVHLLRAVPEALLPALYQDAAVFAFPSLVEGFGLPVLEAMAAGVPVVASTTPAVAEAAEGAALLVSPHDRAGWTRALWRVLHDGRLADHLTRRGQLVARRRTWDDAGRKMLTIAASVATQNPGGETAARLRRRRTRSNAPASTAAERAAPSVPAIGPGLALTPKQRRLRVRVLVAALVLVGAALLSRVALGTAPGEGAPNVLNAAWVVSGAVLRGGQPQDIDFVTMRDVYGVTGVVSFRAATRIERHVVRGFRLNYLSLRLPTRGAPQERQLRRLVLFLRSQRAKGGAVFIHDQGGLEVAPTVAVMLEMLHGTPTLAAVRDAEEATPSKRPLFTARQLTAINALARALSLDPYRPVGYERPASGRYTYPNADTLRW